MNRSLPCIAMLLTVSAARGSESAPLRLEQVPGQAEVGTVEIHGVQAGPFQREHWQAGTLHFVPDERSPLLAPRLGGTFRNIYAPSAVALDTGWLLFYGAWDGVPTGNDRIYSVFTPDFVDFHARQTEIEHGTFIHVCNVSAVRLPDRSFSMLCTVYPDAQDRNKPAFFRSPDGGRWNGSPAPHPASRSDIVDIRGYEKYANADINGVNVLLHEDGAYRMYFCDFKNWGKVYRATSRDGKHYDLEGPCLNAALMVNDVKKLTQGDRTTYLMALHANRERLWYALSAEGRAFEPQRDLASSLGPADRYIVAIGWVTREDRVLGFLYGAGAVPELNRNRIFGRWLQKKLVFTGADGTRLEPVAALGPDRQIIRLGNAAERSGAVQLFAEDGCTPLGDPQDVKLVAGAVYRLTSATSRPPQHRQPKTD